MFSEDHGHTHLPVIAVEREGPLRRSRGAALKVVHTAFVDDDVPQRPCKASYIRVTQVTPSLVTQALGAMLTFHQAELAAPLLVQVSRAGNSPRHGEEVLSPDGSHWHGPAHLWR